ncbi:MAG TPA: RHS repeat-associated core domain-containing protein, partial [Polyangiaceae bacterium]
MTFRIRDAQGAALRCAQTARLMCAGLQKRGETAIFDRQHLRVISTDPAGHSWTYELGARGQVEAITTPMGRVSRMRFDDRGRIEELSEPGGRHTHVPCDEAGAPTRFERNGVEFARFAWDGSHTNCSAEFWDGSTSRFSGTPEGKPLRYTNRLNHVTRFDYGEAGRLVALRDARGQVTRFERNAADLPAVTRHADGRVESLTYLAHDTVALAQDAAPILEMQLDARGQPLAASYADGSAYSLTYDDKGRLTSAEGPHGATSYEYDGAGKLLRETCGDQSFAFEYDARGQLAAMLYPDGTRAQFSYDPDRRLAHARWGEASIECGYDSNERGRSLTTPRLRTQVDFDAAGKPTRIGVSEVATRRALFETAFQHDAQGRLVTKRDSLCGERRFSYDAESQLLGVADERGLWRETFGYDPAGNRTFTSGYNVELAQGNRLLKQGDVACEYDSRGNVVKLDAHGESWRFAYDLRNQMVEAHGPLGRTEFKYDALGRRIEKRTGDHCTRYVWCGEQVTREIITTSAGDSVRDYLYYPGTYEPLALRVDGRIYYYHNDHLATPQRLTDEQGQVAWAADYAAFGFAHVTLELVENPLRLPGQYADVETGLHYNRFRYYSPALGRYLSVDPVGLLGGHNLYLYANNDPVNASDPLGLFSWGALGAAVVGGVAAAALVATSPFWGPIAVVGVGALAVGAVIGVGIAEYQSIGNFCSECFWKGALDAAPEAFAIGLGLGVVTALCAPLGAALIVGGAIYGTYALFDAHFGWSGGKPFDQMTDEEKSEHLGGLVGGTVAGIAGGLVGGLGAGAVRHARGGRGTAGRTPPAEERAGPIEDVPGDDRPTVPDRPPPKDPNAPKDPKGSKYEGETAEMTERGRRYDDRHTIDYDDPATLESRRVVANENGDLVFAEDGRPVNGKGNYIMDKDGNVYFDETSESPTPPGAPERKHSSMTGKGDPAGAGQMEVENGRVKHINDSSGHY